jgi:hypothetical protein
MNDNREIFVPGVYENPSKMSEIHEIGGVRHQNYQRIIFCGQLAGVL